MNRKSALEKIKDKKFKKLCEIIVSEMKRLDVPGVSVGVWKGPRSGAEWEGPRSGAEWDAGEEFSAGFGITSVENPLPVNAKTLFQVGSISKTFTGTLLMRLAEMGKLDLDAPVRAYLPRLQLSDPEVTEKVTPDTC